MKLRRLELKGFRSYREAVAVEFSDGLTAITGMNGSGKSSILEALVWCLYGPVRFTQEELRTQGEKAVIVAATVEHNGKPYEITRQNKNGASTLLLAVADEGELTKSTVAETQAEIDRAFGDYAHALSTWLVPQGEGQRFLQSTPAERRAILGSLLGLTDQWDQLWKKAVSEKNGLDLSAMEKQALLNVATTKAGQHGAMLEAYTKGNEELERLGRLVALAEGERRIAVKVSNDKAAVQQAYRNAIDRITILKAQIEETQASFNQIEARIIQDEQYLEKAPGVHAEVDAYQKTVAAHRQAQVAYETARKIAQEQRDRATSHRWAKENLDTQVTSLKKRRQITLEQPLDEYCPTCKQPLDVTSQKEARQAVVSSLDTEIKALEAKLATLGPEPSSPPLPEPPAAPPAPLEALQAQARLHQTAQSLPGLRAELERLRTRRDNVRAELYAAEKAKPEAPNEADLAFAYQKVQQCETALAAATRDFARQQGQVSFLMQQVEDAQRAVAEQVKLTEGVTALQLAAERMSLVTEALSPTGARQLVLDLALSQVEHHANLILEKIKPGTMMEFRTQAKSGRESLEVWVIDETGLRRWETFSGGERTRLMFATRVALSIAAASAQGMPALPMMAFDESFGDQDAEGRQALTEALTVLSGDIEQVIIVTHDAELAASAGRVITVRRENGSSIVWKN